MIIFVDIFFVIGNLVLYSWLIDFNDEECNKNDVEGVNEVRNNVEGFLGFKMGDKGLVGIMDFFG